MLLTQAIAWLASSAVTAPARAADERASITLSEYKERNRRATSREAYGRALERLKGVEIGMRTDQFFEQMEMLIVKDEEGRALDGFVEGYLQLETNRDNETEKAEERKLVFGYHNDWKRKRDPVERFYVVFRNKKLVNISFVDPDEDPR